MDLKGITADLREYASKKTVIDYNIELHILWHGFMRAYGYIPYDHFNNKMSCYDTLTLLSEMKKESNYINTQKEKINRLRGGL